MKISLDWLAEYLPGTLAAGTAGDALTNGGLPVEVFERHGDDTVIDVEVTSNRGDCLSHVGVARELSALLGREFRDLVPIAKESATPASSALSVAIEAPDLCPHYTARVIRGVKVGPSPTWMVRRLEAVGLRPINNVVDVTNYVMFELGQPLHAFDYAKIGGRRIVVRRARAGEKLVTIDGKEAELASDMLTIADADRPVALAGVMGGKDSEVSDATVDLVLETARFDPLSTRKTARAIVRSESSYRFERGIDPLVTEKASLRAAQLILETAGGELLAGVVEAGGTGYAPQKLTLRLATLKRVLGIELPVAGVMDALTRLRLQPVLKGESVEVTVPSYRLDLHVNDAADGVNRLVGEVSLVEEVARIVGYDKVPVRDEISIRVTPPQREMVVTETIRSTLVASGYFEALTVGFVSDQLAAEFVPPDAKPSDPLPRASTAVRKSDAKLRPSILPGLLEAVRRNETAGTDDARLFEIGSTFYNDVDGKVVERQKVGLVGGGDVREIRGSVELLLAKLDRTRGVTVIPEDRPGFARGASGRIEWGGKPVGYLGLVDKAVADKLSLRHRPVAAELEMAPLLAGAQLVQQLKSLPTFPAVERDVSFVLQEAVRYEAIEAVVQKVNPQWMETLRHATTYRGKPLEKGTKSVTITLVFRSPERTLTGEEVEAAVGKVVDAAKAELGAVLRT